MKSFNCEVDSETCSCSKNNETCSECKRVEEARKKYPEYIETREIVKSCIYCNDTMNDLLLLANKIVRPVMTVDGEDITDELFRLLGIVRRAVKHYQET